LPRLIESSKRIEILALCYELWAEHPDADGVEIDHFEINVNQVAISKADAEKYFSIASSELEKLQLCSRDTSDVVTRADLVDLVSLSKVIAKYRNMTNGEACDWVTTKINPVEAFYDISGFTLPKQLTESKANHAACDCFNQNWWRRPEDEDAPILGYDGLSAKEIAISKADAEKYCFISKSELEELLPEKQLLYTDNTPVIDEIHQTKNGVLKAEKLSHLSEDLIILNEAASVFWLNADPDERDTHPTNEKVADWLKSKGYSAISATQGAVIIRPKWAAKGRR
jgi:hypothetical protein